MLPLLVLLFMGLMSFLRADVCDKDVLIRIEDMLKRLEEVTETNKQFNETITECNTRNAEINSTIEDFKATVEALKAENARLYAIVGELNMTQNCKISLYLHNITGLFTF